jgi:hypothetical protein
MFARVFGAMCLALFASSVFAVHPYDRWAAELGIDQNVSYDGIRVMDFQGGQFEMIERRAPQKMFTEMNLGNMTTGVILREDLQKSYILMPSMGFYREASLLEGQSQAANGMEFRDIEKLGEEDVNGHPSTKYKTRFEDKEGKGAGFIWVTDTGVPIKMEMIYSTAEAKGQRLTMQLTQLNLREQDPSYFEVPANLKPMSMGNLGSNIGQLIGLGSQADTGSATTSATGSGSATGAGAASPSADTSAMGAGVDAIQGVTDSVTEGTKGLMQSIGIGGLFGMGADEPAQAATTQAASSAQLTSDNLTQTVQKHLKALGYDPGNTDGEASTQTSIAISQFQAEKGLTVTGEVTPQLVGILAAEVDK